MKNFDYGECLQNLLFHAYVYEQLRDKFPELMNHVCEVFHKEYNNKEVKSFIDEIKTKTNKTISEFEKLFLLSDAPKLDEKYTDPFKEVMHIVQDASLPIPHPIHSTKPVRIYLEGCWDLMHSGHYNAMRQV